MNLARRSYSPELLDADDIPFEDIALNMRELNTINSLLGGHAITLRGFKTLLAGSKHVHVAEIGCGGGDNLAAIARWCAKTGVELHCTGIDLKPECIEVAAANHALPGDSEWIASDYRAVKFATKPDIIFSSLFCHHFTDEELVGQLRWMSYNCTRGFFINDLHRHNLARLSIKWLTRLFSSSYLVKNDAPLSVARGFRKAEWQALLQKAGIRANVKWQWAFRHLIVYRHEQ